MKPIIFACLSAAAACSLAHGQTAYTDPVGFIETQCLVSSDTIVGVPLRKQGSLRSALMANPSVNGDSVTLTFSEGLFTAGALTNHYIKFIDGPAVGRWYDIESGNTTSTLTIDLNGDGIGGTVATGNQVLIAEYWTLNTLFPPSGVTTGWTLNTETNKQVPNGHAIVASATTSLRTRRTEVLLPDLVTPSYNLAPVSILYITGGAWVDAGGVLNPGDRALWPDTYFTIRQPASVSYPTIFRATGEVEMNDGFIPLYSSAAGARDNFVSLMRPIEVRLDELNLLEGGAFVTSTGTSLRTRRDQLFVFDNAIATRNRAPNFIFYHNGTDWIDASDSSIANARVIQAGNGFMVRKAKTTVATTSFWRNSPTY